MLNFDPPIRYISAQVISPRTVEPLLTEIEQKAFRLIPEEKRELWLLGRLALKEATRAYLKPAYELSLEQIEVTNQKHGAPLVKLLSEPTDCKLHTSISHTKDVAVATVCDERMCAGIGIDIEEIRTFAEKTLTAFLNPDEYFFYSTQPIAQRPLTATLLWSIKESFLKALGTGLTTHPRNVGITFTDQTMEQAHIHFHASPFKHVVSWTLQQNSFIVVQTILKT